MPQAQHKNYVAYRQPLALIKKIIDMEIIQEFAKIGIDKFEDAAAIFKLSLKYFQEIKENKYSSENVDMAEGLLDKMISIANYFEIDGSIINELEAASKNFSAQIVSKNEQAKMLWFNKVIAASMKFYNAMQNYEPEDDLSYGTFQPIKSDKIAISIKISEAIKLINDSEILTKGVKDKLTNSLNNVISELNKPSTNWNTYFSKISYVIIFLGSLGSIAGGVAGVENLLSSRKKLEEANLEVQKTSTSISNTDIKEVFVIKNDIRIESSNLLKLEEKKDN